MEYLKRKIDKKSAFVNITIDVTVWFCTFFLAFLLSFSDASFGVISVFAGILATLVALFVDVLIYG